VLNRTDSPALGPRGDSHKEQIGEEDRNEQDQEPHTDSKGNRPVACGYGEDQGGHSKAKKEVEEPQPELRESRPGEEVEQNREGSRTDNRSANRPRPGPVGLVSSHRIAVHDESSSANLKERKGGDVGTPQYRMLPVCNLCNREFHLGARCVEPILEGRWSDSLFRLAVSAVPPGLFHGSRGLSGPTPDTAQIWVGSAEARSLALRLW